MTSFIGVPSTLILLQFTLMLDQDHKYRYPLQLEALPSQEVFPSEFVKLNAIHSMKVMESLKQCPPLNIITLGQHESAVTITEGFN